MSPTLAERLAAVQERVAVAASANGRDVTDITTIVVTKFHPASLVRSLYELGVRDVGESRHQEAAGKAGELGDLQLTWHFVGQLQSKKARQALEYTSVVHSLDRTSLVDAISGSGRIIDGFIQLNLTDDPARGGVQPDLVESFAESVLASGAIRLRGLMAVAPLGTPPRAAFQRVRALSDRLTALAPEATALSIGMSGDFAEAIAEGATHLRIGTAITGNRPVPG